MTTATRPAKDPALDIDHDKLVRLYGRGLKLADPLVAEAVKRTDGVSAAFIKELMRRTAQAAIARGSSAKKGWSRATPTSAKRWMTCCSLAGS